MDVQLTPEIQARLDHLSSETGRPQEEFIQEAVSGYLDDLSYIREIIATRYEEMESGKVRLIPEEEVIEALRAQSAGIREAQRSRGS